jgi:hypothetical protein
MTQLEGMRIQQPTEAQGYLVAAEAMLSGALPVSKTSPLPAIALTLLCGHGTEAALKALLAQAGLTAAVLSRHPYGHDLITLWEKAVANGARLISPRPQWVDHLHRVHAAPHHLRYPLGFQAIVLPNQQAMLEGLRQLVLATKATVK